MLAGYGIDTVLIGSYPRHVSIRRMQDVEVFSKLPDLPKDVGLRDVHQLFVDVLVDGLDEGLSDGPRPRCPRPCSPPNHDPEGFS